MACAALASVACTVFSARIGVLWPAGPQGGDVVQAVEAAVAIYTSEVAPSWNATVTTRGDGTSVAEGGALCEMLAEGDLIGIVGPASSTSAVFSSFIGTKHAVPIVSPTATAAALAAGDGSFTYLRQTGSLHQPTAVVQFVNASLPLSNAAIAIVHSDTFEDNDRVDELRTAFETAGLPVKAVERIPVSGNYTELFASLRNHYIQVVVVAAAPGVVEGLLTQAVPAEFFGLGRAWIVPDRSIDNLPDAVRNTLRGLLSVRPLLAPSPRYHLLAATLGVEPSAAARFAFDAAWALLQAADTTGSHAATTPPITCYAPEAWSQGPAMLAALDQIDDPNGAAGVLKLQADNYPFELVNLQETTGSKVGWRQVGIFASPDSPVVAHTDAIAWPGDFAPSSGQLLAGQQLHILFIEFAPFVVYNEDTGAVEGFLVDFLDKLAEELKFKYTYDVDTNEGWSRGLELVEAGQYDMQVADTGITQQREAHVDFTQPYLETSSILVTALPENEEELFRFTRPFGDALWATLGIVIAVSAVLFFVLENMFAVKPVTDRGGVSSYVAPTGKYACENSVWYACTAFLNVHGGEPLTRAGRTLALGFFWLSVITLATYTAELAAYLAKKEPIYKVDGIDDFFTGKVSTTSLGVSPDTVNEYWLKMKGMTEYEKLSTNNDGNAKVERGELVATVQDSVWAGWFVQQGSADGKCLFEVRGAGWNPRGVGLALQNGSPYVDALSQKILEMRESGALDAMRSEWFIGDCVVEAEADEEDGLTLQSFGGVLVMYGAFVGLAIAVRVLMIIRVRLYGAAVSVVRRNTNRGGGGPLEADRSESSLSLDAVSAATPRVAMLTNLFQRIVPDQQAPARKNLSALDHPLQRKNTALRSI